jgi:hypothetical protein
MKLCKRAKSVHCVQYMSNIANNKLIPNLYRHYTKLLIQPQLHFLYRKMK